MTAERIEVARNNRQLIAFRTAGDDPTAPVVVCESGLGDNHRSWDRLIDELRPAMTVVRYDRAGYGDSTPPSDRRHLRDIAGDLVAVCDALASDQRVVLVGHSMGGRIARAASATLGRDRVAGLVLVEGAPDDFPASMPRATKGQRWSIRALGYLGIVGVMRTRRARDSMARTIGDNPEALDAAVRDSSRAAFWRAVWAEWESMVDEMPVGPRDVPAVELIGASWTNWSKSMTRRFGATQEQLMAFVRAQFEEQYPNGRVVMVENTTHHIQRDHPDLVADAVREVAGLPTRT